MKKQGKTLLLTALLALTLLMPAAAHSHPQDTPVPLDCSDWAAEEITRAEELGLISPYFGSGYKEPITRMDFCEMALAFAAARNDMDFGVFLDMAERYLVPLNQDGSVQQSFTDCTVVGEDRMAAIAYHLNIVSGRGDGIFDPQGLITRQEAAVMLCNAARVTGISDPWRGDDAIHHVDYYFIDSDAIDTWARNEVAMMAYEGILKGMGDDTFAPLGTFSAEQCVVTFLRLFEKNDHTLQSRFTQEQVLDHLQKVDEETRAGSVGYTVAFRLDGPEASVVRMDWGGSMHATSALYVADQEGGLRSVDLGLCTRFRALTPDLELENPRFSEDGKTFLCEVTLTEDAKEENVTTHPKGLYHVTVDVDTKEVQLQREDLA